MESTIQIGDTSSIPKAYFRVAKLYSNMMGPRMCDELLALIQHMFTEEEAEVMQHMRPLLPKTAAGLAKASGRTAEEIKPIMHSLAHEKYILISVGSGRREVYVMAPLLPGTFEYVLVRRAADSATEWHRGFAEKFEALYKTGYIAKYPKYTKSPLDMVRYLPVGEIVDNEPMALPSDRLEVVLDHFDQFAIGVCQCRLAKNLIDESCGRMLETCTIMGPTASKLIREDRMTQASKKDVLEVKRAAEKEGLINYMIAPAGNSRLGNTSCSCCGCCCDMLRIVSEFNAPGIIAPPHFMPEINSANCNNCGKCVKACQMKALVMVGENDAKEIIHQSERCIGCGLCAVACANNSLALRPVPDYKEPPKGWFSYATRYLPNYISNARNISSRRRHRT